MKLFIILNVLLSLLGNAAWAESRLALVIGNKDYSSGGLFKPLTNPLNDAEDMKVMLEKYRFKVISLVLNGDQREMDNAIQEFIDQLPSEGTALLYYSGHGVEVKGENYLIPVRTTFNDADDVRYGAVNAHKILSKMGRSKKRVNILILDACLENLEESKGFEGKGLADMNAAGVIVSYATTHGERSYGNKGGRNSVYTGSLLKVLESKGNLPIEQVFKQARVAVADVTDFVQVPVTRDGLIGDFCFGICNSEQDQPIDTDTDGVPVYVDRCPGVLRGVPVDETGCPIFQKITTVTGKTIRDFSVPKKIESDSELLVLLLQSESMNDGERQYWLNLTESMTGEQIENLRNILRKERSRLDEIDRKYGRKRNMDQ